MDGKVFSYFYAFSRSKGDKINLIFYLDQFSACANRKIDYKRTNLRGFRPRDSLLGKNLPRGLSKVYLPINNNNVIK